MKTINYIFADGDTSEVEVADELAEELKKLNDNERNNNRTERRQHNAYIEGEYCLDFLPLQILYGGK